MKYSGVRKIETISVENDSNQVVKQKKKNRHFFNIIFVQFCICLTLVCVFSISWLFTDNGTPVFKETKPAEDITKFSVPATTTGIETMDGDIILKQSNNMVRAIYSGEIVELTEGQMTVKYNGDLSVVYKNLNNCFFKVGDKVEKNAVIALKTASQDSVLNILYKSNIVTKFEIDGKNVKWQEK